LFEQDLGFEDEKDIEPTAEAESVLLETDAEDDSAVAVTSTVEEAAPHEERVKKHDTYVVQKGFSAEGLTYHPGDVISVKCKYCALWNREWLGKVRCSPGRLLEDVPMSAERFSCETFFVCKEMDAELNAFLKMPLPEVQTVKRLIPSLKRLLDTERWLADWADRNNVENVPEVWKNAKGFIMAFGSVEQIGYIDHFIRSYCTMLARREKERRPTRPKYEAGDWVDFTDLKSGQTVSAIILSMGRGLIRLAGVKAHSGQKYEFPMKEWKLMHGPRIVRKTAEPTSV